MRLIDADAIKSKLAGSRFKYIRNFLNKQPTIDAVPVVRCKIVSILALKILCMDIAKTKCAVLFSPTIFAVTENERTVRGDGMRGS